MIFVSVLTLLKTLRRILQKVSLGIILGIAALVLILGAVAFSKVEHVDIFTAMYWSIITMATIGYGDVVPRTSFGRILAIVMAVVGISSFTSLITVITNRIITFATMRVQGMASLKRKNHVVIVGWGEAAREAVRELSSNLPELDIVVVARERPQTDDRVDFVRGEPTDEDALRRASVDKAKYVIVCPGNDADTITSILHIRAMNKTGKIIAEALRDSSIPLLRQAGADIVVPTRSLGGRLLASAVFEPGVAMFIEDVSSSALGTADLVEVCAEEYSGRSVGEVLLELKRSRNALLLAIRRGDKVIVNPPLDHTLLSEDRLILLAPKKPKPPRATP